MAAETDPMAEDTMALHSSWRLAVLTIALTLLVGAPALAADTAPATTRELHQRSFATPAAAVQALITAVRAGDTKRIGRVLGPDAGKLIRSGDPVADRLARERFVAAYEKQFRIEQNGDAKAILLIGEKDWPFPFPLVKQDGRWSFDAKSGAEEILNRRIGRNELSAIQACLAYVDAQREYALTAGNDHGLHQYARKFISTPGKKDGLYWPAREGEPASPVGPLAAKAQEEGYGKSGKAGYEPYHGYFYRILTEQGGDAPTGAYDYIVRGKMIGGFALVAYPARWGASGVMTFIVNHDGVVYQKNLGGATVAIASKMTSFNPDATWSKVQQ